MIGACVHCYTVFLANSESLNSGRKHFGFRRSLCELVRPHGQCFDKKGCGVLEAWSDVDLDNGCNDIFSSIPLCLVYH